MTSWKSETIQSNGLKIHYTRTDGDKPPFVLAHDFSDDGLCWMPIAQQLERDYEVIMTDARGHGRSEGPEEGYATALMADDMAGVIQGLGLSKPIVMGHSMGGWIIEVKRKTREEMIIPGAGHNIRREQPVKFMETVLGFVK